MDRDRAMQIAVRIVEQLESEQSDVIPHYLVRQTLESALLKAGQPFPIVGIDPITMSLKRAIDRLSPGMSSQDQRDVRHSLTTHLKDSGLANHFFELLAG